MVLSTPIPTEMAAIVIVIISKGIFNHPMIPKTSAAAIAFGMIQIMAIDNDLKSVKNINIIANITTPIVSI